MEQGRSRAVYPCHILQPIHSWFLFNEERLSRLTLFHMVRRTFQRLMRQSPQSDVALKEAFDAYADAKGAFSKDAMWLEGFREQFEKEKQPVDLVHIWREVGSRHHLTTGVSGFVNLAIRILSMVPNSASVECAFSAFGGTHTKSRNRISPQKVHNATLVRMDRRRAHAKAGLVADRKKRKFGETMSAGLSPSPSSSLPSSQTMQGSASTDELDDDLNGDEIADFAAISSQLIKAALQADEDDWEDEPGDTPEGVNPAAARTSPAAPMAAAPTTAQSGASTSRIPAYRHIKLSDIFEYPREGCTPSELEVYWMHGKRELQDEEAELEAQQADLFSSPEPRTTN
ncbi:hypothetical protein HGRIS_014911 [Hohenbuehelia grisea]|uniref:HAT C-terminal dimerisation domain-containing protein n=1 Tax=Hohenbuehelia grisea TaxID=104357 RepID=A0ABR3JJI4_9AGAR